MSMIAARAALTMAGLTAALLLAVALLVGTCGSTDSIDREPLTIVTADGVGARLQVEIADTPEERTQGLMGRTELPPDTGMLFVIEPPGRGFWMRNTPLPLTVAFIGRCGVIVDFADLDPFSEEVKNTDREYRFALEVERGWFERNGISRGDLVSLPRDLRHDGC